MRTFIAALISDLHANAEGTEAVLADIAANGNPPIYCLGDIVGYGPDPNRCIDLMIARCAKVVLGNHDQGALFDPDGFNPKAMESIFWTREQIEKGNPGENRQRREERWEFLSNAPRAIRDPKRLYVHASPRNPTNEYVFPDDLYNSSKMDKCFALVDDKGVCFQGHTHVPGIFIDKASSTSGDYEFVSQDKLGDNFEPFRDRKLMINVGSVGQPRDGDPKACYVLIWDDGNGNQGIQYRRVAYDHTVTAAKLRAILDLSQGTRESLADRLAFGR